MTQSHRPASPSYLHQSLNHLRISQATNAATPNSKAPSKAKAASKSEPADSWEDEDISSASSTDTEQERSPAIATLEEERSRPNRPPPTPSSPTLSLPSRAQSKANQRTSITPKEDSYAFTTNAGTTTDAPPTQRPEKSTAVASRLIAAGIGQKAPRRTKEEREYDAAMRAQERKKREDAKAAGERKVAESERMKREVWGD